MWNRDCRLCVLPLCRRARKSERVVYWSPAQPNAKAEANRYQPHRESHMNPSKAVIAGAAIAGLLTGSYALTYAASTSHNPGVSLQTMADEKKPLPKHACKGLNDCKGQGGGENWGKNDCKGKGGCATDGSQGQGGDKNSGKSGCKGKNGCAAG